MKFECESERKKMRMKSYRWLLIGVLGLGLRLNISAQNSDPNAAFSTPPLNALSPASKEVLKLSNAKLGDSVVLGYIDQSTNAFHLSAADILTLKDAGISSPILTAMLKRDSLLQIQADSKSNVVVTTQAPTSTPIAPATVPAPAPAPPNPTTNIVINPVMVQPPQPAPQVEVIPIAPTPDYVWVPGYWSWNGITWIWIRGSWRYPSRPGHLWIGGHFEAHGHRRFWVGGHWH